jgi:S-adenosylmethionine decarboxylase
MGRLLQRFSDCDAAALVDVAGLVRALRRATAAAGATSIQSAEERFAPDGFRAAIVTRESEARLRTLPEQAACLVEFRCDDGCRVEAFATLLGAYLRSPGRVRRLPVTVHPAPQRSAGTLAAPRSA